MRKLGGKSFWIILGISMLSLIVLTVGVIFLTRESEEKFLQAGYIISSNATKTNRYFFDDDTVYKENIFDEYVFTDSNNKEVTTSKDNFIHYLDNSISFMKNGVILDLGGLDTSLVPYYNITNKSVIKYNNGGYYVETNDKTLVFSNFLGKINDDKYIVAGSKVRVKLAGNDEEVNGEYFEILFVEDGIVKIENEEGSYQTVADGTIIYVGDDIKINLGTGELSKGDEKKLTLSEMTIDGNENIDIVPQDGLVDNPQDEDNTDNGNNDSENNIENNSDNGEQDNENIEGTEGNGSVLKKEVSVDLLTAEVGINYINASFQVIDTANIIKGNLVATLTNMTTGDIVNRKILENVSDIQNFNTSSLSPDCTYSMTVIEENNTSGIEYFRRVFNTETLDLRLIRDLVTTDSLSYVLDFGISSGVKSANVSAFDKDNHQVGITHTIVNGDTDGVTFEGLEKNSTYHIVVDSVIFDNTNYAQVYKIETSDMTLKEKPVLGNISVSTDIDNGKFTLKMEEPIDTDDSIVRYTYEIYSEDDLKKDMIPSPVYVYHQEELKDLTLTYAQSKLEEKKNYLFRVVVEYYDNYKYNEIETANSEYFMVLGRPKIEFIPENVDFNQIIGTIKMEDDGCTIPFEGRVCGTDTYNETSNIIVRYRSALSSSSTTIKDSVFVPDETEENVYNMKLHLTGLTENTTYIFEVYADIDLKNGAGLQVGQYIGGFTVTTKGIDALKMQNWKQNSSVYETPISVSGEMVSTVAESDYSDKLASLTFKLYQGDVSKNLKEGVSVDSLKSFTDTESVAEKYYNKEFSITSNMFGITNLDELRELSGGKLSRYYTIEVTDAYDADRANRFEILDNIFVFETPSILLLEDEVEAPTIIVEELTNNQMRSNTFTKKYDSNLGNNIVVGYRVIANFNKEKIESYFQGNTPVMSINFHIYKNGKEVNIAPEDRTIDLTNEDSKTKYFFLDYGTDYYTDDNNLRRGNGYTFDYDISIDTNNDGLADTEFPSNRPTSEEMVSKKQDPVFRMYIDNSTDNSITYKYKITDYDNALYKERNDDSYYLYYTVGEDEYKVPITKESDYTDVTISNLIKASVYNIDYYRANVKKEEDINKINMGKYLFDGSYDASDYNLGYKLEYGNFDNRLKIILDDNDFLNRVSAYRLTLTAGEDTYETVLSSIDESSDCDDKRCVIVDYSTISKFKGKDVKVKLEAFYDTGYIGFSQPSRLGDYFKNLGYVTLEDAPKVGYVYQNTNTETAGKYVYINNNGAIVSAGSSVPQGILGYTLTKGRTERDNWTLTTVNLLDMRENKFTEFGKIQNSLAVSPTANGIFDQTASSVRHTFNPKVLDVVDIQTDNNNFRFNSIIPKISYNERTDIRRYINGASIDINLSIDPDTLKTDFVEKDGKYKFYIDIYTKNECGPEEDDCESLSFVKRVETDYENLKNVTFDGLDPDSEYYFKILADMNRNNDEPTPLFDNGRSGYVEFLKSFRTLNKDELFDRVEYDYTSEIKDDEYSYRTINFTAFLKNNVNFDLRYELYGAGDDLKYQHTVKNNEIETSSNLFTAKYNENITGRDFVFGAGYYTLKIYAVTTDLGKELEIFNDVLNNDFIRKKDIDVLENPVFSVPKHEAEINDGNYSLSYEITVKDPDKVINDGIYHIELQTADYRNACENNGDCQITVDIKNNTCTFGSGGNKNCTITGNSGNIQSLKVTFDSLKPDTNYILYVYGDTYRNNVNLEEKEGLVYVRVSQYTKSELGFSLGSVTPTAVSKNKLTITFAGATNNLSQKLKKIEYSVNVIGGENVAKGTLLIGDNATFGSDKDGYPTLDIIIPSDKELGLNNYILLTYYYDRGDGTLEVLKFGDNTMMQYSVKNEN